MAAVYFSEMLVSNCLTKQYYNRNLSIFFYIYKSESGWLAGWLAVHVCLCVARQLWAVAMQRGRFLWGPFWVHYLAMTSI
jgi:hypothetical protein